MAQKLLLHCNGLEGDVSFVDASPQAHKLVVGGVAHVTTAQSKFGGASLRTTIGINPDEIHAASSTDFDIVGSSGDYTLSLWVKCDNAGGPASDMYLVTHRQDGANGWLFSHNNLGVLYFAVYSAGSQILGLSGGSITDDNWHWLLMAKVGTKYGIYLDGVQVAYVNDSSNATFIGDLIIGNNAIGGTSNIWCGWIDEVYMANDNTHSAAPNVALTDTITVPTVAYTGLPARIDAQQLFSNSSEDPTQNMQFTVAGVVMIWRDNALYVVSTGVQRYYLQDNVLSLI